MTSDPAGQPADPKSKRRGLGRGLSALLAETPQAAPPESAGPQRLVAITSLHPGRFQPRRQFETAAIDSLALSLKSHGMLQPILVRPHQNRPGEFEIVAGERRWRAAQQVPLHEVPIIEQALSDAESLEIGLIENLQRRDLTAIEEAEGYRRLAEEFGHGQAALAEIVGRSRSHVANMLRLLGLPEPVQALVQAGSLSGGHARALVPLDAARAATLAREIVEKGLSVREAERRAGAIQEAERDGAPSRAKRPQKDADTAALERDLSDRLGLRVAIEAGRKGGTVTLHWRDLDQLDALIARLSGG